MRRRYNMWGLGQEVGEEIEYQEAMDSGAQLSPQELAIAKSYGIVPKTTAANASSASKTKTYLIVGAIAVGVLALFLYRRK
jgi:hypothetical protein